VVCEGELRNFFGRPTVNKILEALQENSCEFLNKNLSPIRDEFHSVHTKRILDIYSDIKLKLHRVLNPTGLWITIMGPDGSGKSTIINNIETDLLPCFRRKKYFHLYPKESGDKKKNASDPHAENPRGTITAFVKLLYYMFLYNTGYLLKVKPAVIKSTFVIFDRYYHDIFIDPRRYRFKKGGVLVKIVSKFIPKPEKWFLLDVSPEIIQERKTEVSFEETARHVKEYQYLFNNISEGYVIDGNQSIEDVTFEIEKRITSVLKERTRKRYRNILQ